MEAEQIRRIVEAALLASDGPLTVANLVKLFAPGELDEENANKQIREALQALEEDSAERGVELKRVASGYRYQVQQGLSEWVSRLWEEKPPRYTRALLETLALVAYKQPVTRGDIEQVRGVSVSQNIMRTLLERDWIKVVGVKEVPGRPALYGTTKAFLDYFNLKSLDELPPLAEIRALIEPTLAAAEGQAEGLTAAPSGEAENRGVEGEGESEGGSSDASAATVAEAGVVAGEVEAAAEDAEADNEGHDATAAEDEAAAIPAHVELPEEVADDPLSGADNAAAAKASAADEAESANSAEVVQLHTGGSTPAS